MDMMIQLQANMSSMQDSIVSLQQQRNADAEAAAASAALASLANSQRQAPYSVQTIQPAPEARAAPLTPAPAAPTPLRYPPGLQPPRPAVDPLQPAAVQPRAGEVEGVRLNVQAIARDPTAAPSDRQAAAAWLAEDAAQLLDEEDAEENDARWEQLYSVVDPLATHKAAETSVFYQNAFSGYPLYVPYWQDNPFGRDRNLQHKTNHYHPERVSDPMCGSLLNDLQAKGYTANAYEGRTLVPALSYMHDSLQYFKDSTADALRLADAQDYKKAAETAIDSLITLAKQHDSITQHLMERLAVLRTLASGDAPQLALLNNMYDNEQRGGMSMGRTEAMMDANVQSGLARNLIAASAKHQATQALPPARTRSQQQTVSQTAGAPPVSRELANALGRHQTRQQPRGRGQPQQQQQQQQQSGRPRAPQPQQQQQQGQQGQSAQAPAKGAGRGGGRGGGGGGGRGGRGATEPSGSAQAASLAASE